MAIVMALAMVFSAAGFWRWALTSRSFAAYICFSSANADRTCAVLSGFMAWIALSVSTPSIPGTTMSC